MKSTPSAILLVLVCVVTEAQVSLKGEAPNFAGKSISVFEYHDFFTRKRHEVLSQVIDSRGEFDIPYSIEKRIYVEVFLNGIFSGVYVQPGFTYKFHFDQAGKVTSVISVDKTNELVQSFENRTLNFYKSSNSKKDKNFEEFINLEKEGLQNAEPFLSEILTYRISELQYLLAADQRDTSKVNILEKQVLGSSGINNSIPDYYNFIKLYAYDRARSLKIRREPYDFTQHLKSLLKEVKHMGPDSIQQLAALVILRKAYRSDWSGPKERVDHLTDSIVNNTVNPTVRKIAINVKQDGNAFNPGNKIDDFSFSTHSGETYKLSSFRGKYVLIDFWFTACGPCIKNFPKLKMLKQQYADRLEIISLTPTDTREKVNSFLKKHPDYTWLFSNIDKDDLVMNYFNVLYFPTYFLIDPDGNLVKRIGSAEMEKSFQSVVDLIK
jgi:thiol-disulfide isomerase/thioredoxin